MKTTFYPKGVCSRRYEINLEDGVIRDIEIVGGCNGNLKGIRSLILGRKAEEIIGLLRGTTCGNRPTSCPDQISIALEQALEQEKAAAQAAAVTENAQAAGRESGLGAGSAAAIPTEGAPAAGQGYVCPNRTAECGDCC